MLRSRRFITTATGSLAGLAVLIALAVPALVAPPPAAAESLKQRAQKAAQAARDEALATARAATARAVAAKQKAEKALVTARSVYRILTVTPPTTTTLVPPPPVASLSGPVPQYAVRRLTWTFVDPTRSTEASKGVPGTPSRTLTTTIWYPSDAAGVAFPLVVFGHGMGAVPTRYASLLSYVAAHGYVVAAPTFPVSSRAGSGVSQLVDGLGAEGEQPADLKYVIDQTLALGAAPGPLQGRIDASRVGAAGHSLGAVTALSLGYNPCCFDPRLRAVVAVAGVPNLTRRDAFFTVPPVPLLLVHGDADATVPYVGSALAFAAAGSPKYLLTVLGGDHAFGLARTSGSRTVVGGVIAQAFVAFLDRYLKDRPVGIDRLRSLAQAQPSLVRLDIG